MKIKNFYCNGFFGRRYDLENAEIIAESDYTITIKTEETEEVLTATFDSKHAKEVMKEEWTTGLSHSIKGEGNKLENLKAINR